MEFLPLVLASFPAGFLIGVVAIWGGIYDESLDGFPILGQLPEVSGFYVAMGLSGHGFKLAQAISRMTVSAILEGRWIRQCIFCG